MKKKHFLCVWTQFAQKKGGVKTILFKHWLLTGNKKRKLCIWKKIKVKLAVFPTKYLILLNYCESPGKDWKKCLYFIFKFSIYQKSFKETNGILFFCTPWWEKQQVGNYKLFFFSPSFPFKGLVGDERGI